MEKYLSKSPEETQKIGEDFARQCLEKKLSTTALVIGLKGDLGAGKTTFLQGFAKGLKIAEKILSPTFIIMRRSVLGGYVFENFYHLDCYRLQDEKDLEALRFAEIIENPKNIIAIEWAERVINSLPKNTVKVTFIHLEGDSREISIENF